MSVKEKLGLPGAILIAILALVLVGAVVMFLWNLLLPRLFGFPVLTWGEAVLLWLLVRIFVGHSNKVNIENKLTPRR
jgi:hypothetical protein